MFIRVTRYLLAIFFFGFLSGCTHYVQQRQTEYLHSYEVAPLRLPANYSSTNIGSDYVIPPVPGCVPTQPVSVVPPGCPGVR